MNYQRKDLATGSLIGVASPLPHELVGLADDALANMSWASPVLGYVGQGFFPVVPTLDDAKKIKAAEIDLQFMYRFGAGFPCTIQGHSDSLQMRPEDLVNWLVFKDACDDGIAGGHGTDLNPLPIRTTLNNEYALPNSQGRDLMIALRTYAAGLMRNHWLLKDALATATTDVAVAAIDVTAGWPVGGFSVG